jgi:hypothetical protein
MFITVLPAVTVFIVRRTIIIQEKRKEFHRILYMIDFKNF